jgi:hypothetical protein
MLRERKERVRGFVFPSGSEVVCSYRGGPMKEGKQIAYFYDTILAEEETELDLDGSVAVPAKGDTRPHGGKTWRVEHVRTDHSGGRALPIYCVYLKEIVD